MACATSTQTFDFGDLGDLVGSFLDAKCLANAEQAKLLNECCCASLWGHCASLLLQDVAPWGNSSEKLMPAEPTAGGGTSALREAKRVLWEVEALRMKFVTPSPAWAPEVTAVSSSCLRALPRPKATGAPQQTGGAPPHACLALRLGAYAGSTLAVGVRMSCRRGGLSEGCCFGVESVGCNNGWGCFCSITFSPSSGRIFMQFEESNPALCVDALPPMKGYCREDCGESAGHQADEEDQEEECVEAWVKVTEEGAIFFMRQTQEGPLEATGVLAADSLPGFVREYHATMHFYADDIKAPTDVSVLHAGPHLPPAMRGQEPAWELDSVWYMMGHEHEAEEEPQQ
uniref:Uncharacterized protein n=1 Tax=Alexandrium andersonii TaxID=327968 RepID=A0A7S2D638_9DINO